VTDRSVDFRSSAVDLLTIALAVAVMGVSFLPWQRAACCGRTWNAWGGDGQLAGGVMVGLAAAVVAMGVLRAIGRPLPPPIPHDYVLGAVIAGTALFGVLKALLVMGRHPAFGSWLGLGLAAAVAGAGWWTRAGRRGQIVKPDASSRTG
jgi:hypothetical protein